MIFRKPYAFLIRNFKKIHIALLLISLYVAYKVLDVNSFVNEFMKFGMYDLFQNPVSRHITIWLKIAILLLIVGSGALLLLLRHKGKPWKIYLVPVIEYISLFFVLNMISSFFKGYSTTIETTDLRLSRDLLLMFLLAQLPAIGIFVMRVFGLDIKKFNFNSDQEFLELSEEDREEFEVSINIDKNSFKRFYRKSIRNFSYFYMEHKAICIALIAIIVFVGSFNIYKAVFVTHKSYSEGNNYSINGYTIKIHNSYFTDKDYSGKVISKNSNFVIVDMSVTNHDAPRKLNTNNFHIRGGTSDYVTTEKIYAKEFQDFGKTYESVRELKRDETLRFIIVYKVSKKLRKNQFNLFYQEDNYLRKIKLDLKDLSKLDDPVTIKLGDEMSFEVKGKKQNVSLDYYEFFDSLDFTVRICHTTSCSVETKNYVASGGNKVLKIDFASDSYEGKDMVDFSIDYGKIIYIDNSNGENEKVELDFHYPFSRKTTGKYIYTLVPQEVENSEQLDIIYTVRNKKYVYKLK